MTRDEFENPTQALYERVLEALNEKRDLYRSLGNDDAATAMMQAAVELRREYEMFMLEMEG